MTRTSPEYLIAGDPELQDGYLAREEPSLLHYVQNPLVRVLRIARYPIQHAIMFPEIPNENTPVPEGSVCRLARIRAASEDEARELLALSWEESLARALAAYEAAAPDGEREILERHRHGEFRKKRVMICK